MEVGMSTVNGAAVINLAAEECVQGRDLALDRVLDTTGMTAQAWQLRKLLALLSLVPVFSTYFR